MEQGEGVRGTMVEPTISVIVPVRSAGRDFRKCMRAIAGADPPPTEVIVVADGDEDGSRRGGEECRARVVRMGRCCGPARARNQGARVAGSDILFFIDADVTIRPDAVGQVAAIFEREPHLAALFGSYDDAPSGRNFLSQYKNLLHHYVHQTSSEDASTFWAACGAIRRDVFMSVGGFDERYVQPSIEDLELGWRLTQAGYAIRLCKSLQVTHAKCWSAASLLRSDFFHRALPWTELILQDRRFINDLNLRLSSRFSVALVHGLSLTLIASWWAPHLMVVGSLLIVGLLVLNAPVYSFFRRKRGWWFAVRAVPWHWFYHLYCGFAFAVGTAAYLARGLTNATETRSPAENRRS